MTDYRDDETEPMTRLLGVVVREPREGEPQKRLIDHLHDRKPAELTRLEIARPRTISTYASKEPATQIVTPDLMRPALSLSTDTMPGPVPRRPAEEIPTPRPAQPFASADRESPAMPIKPVFAPRLSQADQHEITASRKAPPRALPILLGVALVALVVMGASLLRDRSRAARRVAQAAAEAAQLAPSPAAAPAGDSKPTGAAAPIAAIPAAAPAAAEPVRAPAPEMAAAAERVVPEPEAEPERGRAAEPEPEPEPEPITEPAPAPAAAPATTASAPLDEAAIADLEKRAVDRLRDNDHEAALALYTELVRAQPANPAFPVMVSLLTRRIRACQGDPSCAR